MNIRLRPATPPTDTDVKTTTKAQTAAPVDQKWIDERVRLATGGGAR
jgi:hypothetical protein